VIATVYFSLDLERVNAAASRLLPRAVYNWLVTFKRGFFSIGLRYIRAYLTLMLVTFSVILVGLLFLGRRYALLLSFIIAFLDLLPVIGVSTVLVPWSLYEIVFADRAVGIGLIILLVVHELIRQFCEPKIIGENLGVHPIVTLAVIYIGYSLFGFGGILIVPIAIVLIKIGLGKKYTAEVDKA
jgi:sporulation integral membrane protein YtvI